jgi:hypothetical protein
VDFNELLSVRAFKFDSLETLFRLQYRFRRYVEILTEFANDAASDHELDCAQQELLRVLRAEEHRFYEWQSGEWVLNKDVFGLAESPIQYLQSGTLEDADRSATAAFERLIDHARNDLRQIEQAIFRAKNGEVEANNSYPTAGRRELRPTR